MSVTTLNKNNFEVEVLKSEKPVLIDLWASWCGPCRMLSPLVDEIAEAHPEIKVCKINVDEEPELSQAFRVSAIPMLAYVVDGKIAKTAVGFQPKNRIEALLA